MFYRTILVPLDGSSAAEYALPTAAEIARVAGATLRLVHVHTLTTNPIYIEGQPVLDKNLLPLGLEHEKLYLEQLGASLRDRYPTVKITVEVLNRSQEAMLNEPVGTFLAKHVVANGVDLMVMTTHGRGGLARFWLGSVADMLVRLTHVPLLLVRPAETPPDLAQPLRLQRLLIPLDGSALAAEILAPALALAALMHAEATLLRIVEPLYVDQELLAYKEQLDGEAIQEAQTYVADLAQRTDPTVATQVILAPQPALTILDYAQSHEYDLIAMATHGRSGLKRLLIGSVADKVLRGAETPILVWRPQLEQA